MALPAANLVRNGGFEEGLKAWETPVAQQFTVSREQPHGGTACLVGSGVAGAEPVAWAHLAQTLPGQPFGGLRYRLAGMVRGTPLASPRRARLAVREVGADDKTITYHEIELRPTADWRPVSHEFRASAGADKLQAYVILSHLEAADRVALDDLQVVCLEGDLKPLTARPLGFTRRVGSYGTTEPVIERLRGQQFEARIDLDTGLLTTLIIHQPKHLVMHPEAIDVSRVFVQLGDREVLFRRALGNPVIATARGAKRVSIELGPEDPALPVKVRMSYTMTPLGFEEEAEFIASAEVPGLVRVGLRHGFEPLDWDRLHGALRPVRSIDPEQSTVFTYGDREGVVPRGVLEPWQSVTYPLTVLEGEDRWLVVGDRSLDRCVTVAPNEPKGYFPSVQQTRTSLRPGEPVVLALSYRVYPKTTHLLRDVWRAYGRELESENPLLAGGLTYEGKYPPRTLPPGPLVTSSAHYVQGKLQLAERTLPGANVWFFGWHDWIGERYPTQGSWWSSPGGWQRVEAAALKRQLSDLKAAGLKPYLYFRHIASLAPAGQGTPAEWVKREAGGALERWGGGYQVRLPEAVAAEVGFTEIPWGTYDFGHPALREDFLQQVREVVDYYQPAGIAWDMDWLPHNPGLLAVQAETFNWLRAAHPALRVITNEACGTPSGWFSDAVMLENGILYGKSVADYEVSKATDAQLFAIERPEMHIKAAEILLAGKSDWPFPSGLEDAKRFADWARYQGTAAQPPPARDLGRQLYLRAGLRNLGLGANWAYVDLLPLTFGVALPPALLDLVTQVSALPAVTRSFALKLNSAPADREEGLYASAWATKGQLRVAVFNDTPRPRPVQLHLSAETLREHNWVTPLPRATGQATVVNTEGQATAATVKGVGESLQLEGSLPPFSLLIWSAGETVP